MFVIRWIELAEWGFREGVGEIDGLWFIWCEIGGLFCLVDEVGGVLGDL